MFFFDGFQWLFLEGGYIRHIGNMGGSIVGGEEGEGGTKKKREKGRERWVDVETEKNASSLTRLTREAG